MAAPTTDRKLRPRRRNTEATALSPRTTTPAAVISNRADSADQITDRTPLDLLFLRVPVGRHPPPLPSPVSANDSAEESLPGTASAVVPALHQADDSDRLAAAPGAASAVGDNVQRTSQTSCHLVRRNIHPRSRVTAGADMDPSSGGGRTR